MNVRPIDVTEEITVTLTAVQWNDVLRASERGARPGHEVLAVREMTEQLRHYEPRASISDLVQLKEGEI